MRSSAASASASSPRGAVLDAPLSQHTASSLFPRSAFLLLDPPPAPNTTLTIDASPYYTTSSSSQQQQQQQQKSKLQGFKLIPDGIHLLTLTSDGTQTIHLQGVIFFSSGHQVLLRSIAGDTTLVAPDQPPSSLLSRTHSPAAQPQTLVGQDHLRTLDPYLIPYPHTTRSAWTDASAHLSRADVGPGVVSRVCGIDEWTGDAHVDSFTELDSSTPSSAPGTGLSAAERRLEEQLRSGGVSTTKEEKLRFTSFDLRRSWKVGTVGTELTRWSVDKSWLLADTVRRAGGLSILLAEFELAFLLFHRLHSPAAHSHWTALLALFSQSGHACSRAPAHFDAHPADPRSKEGRGTGEEEEQGQGLEREIGEVVGKERDMHARFLQTVLAQLRLIVAHSQASSSSSSSSSPQQSTPDDNNGDEDDDDQDFFSTLHPTLESDLLRELSTVRRNISAGLASRAAFQRTKPTSSPQTQSKAEEIESLLAAWRALSHFSSQYFGWSLDDELDEEAEVREDEEAEEGEDAPVVVELEDEYGDIEG
ncbi:unnamed protein product [Tilletia caries]|uniref:A1 cistron-splicing factor AAR2 n=1 Tax=Tilletia caries TaxID=13290 RepID=A0ABN7IPD7_9BASI|nr:unnamed protein product [Tilletia caries]